MSTSRLLVLAATLPVFTNYVIQLNDWFCGNRYIVSYISHMFMAGDCQGYAATVNHCCAYHDECYSLQRGQTTCDEEFCDCLEDASEGSPTFCHILIMGKCQLVIGFGVSTYKDSKMDTPLDIARVSVDTVDMRDAVDHLYDACPWIKKIVKSCVLLYNFCFRANRTEACKISFEKCLKDAAAYHPANECISAVEHPGGGSLQAVVAACHGCNAGQRVLACLIDKINDFTRHFGSANCYRPCSGKGSKTILKQIVYTALEKYESLCHEINCQYCSTEKISEFRGTVYMIICDSCGEKYIDETMRPLCRSEPLLGANAELGRTWRWSIPSRLRPFEFRTLIVVGFLGVSLCLITAVVACVLMCKGKENEADCHASDILEVTAAIRTVWASDKVHIKECEEFPDPK
ncbi:hypothetical protein Y032_0417g1101 [Ancylostoma ceylanicum]|uniref:Phospholipase A2 n=1 Tax=Ancylostoma ceylanicum TaxID=53326 RepID=A0A016X1N7_9BILA|nr:hypothetical protein Y032_0417g1101 [Ancylostoma ceylanicum]